MTGAGPGLDVRVVAANELHMIMLEGEMDIASAPQLQLAS